MHSWRTSWLVHLPERIVLQLVLSLLIQQYSGTAIDNKSIRIKPLLYCEFKIAKTYSILIISLSPLSIHVVIVYALSSNYFRSKYSNKLVKDSFSIK